MTRPGKVDTELFKRMWEAGTSCAMMGAQFGLSDSWVSKKAQTIPGLTKRKRGIPPPPVQRNREAMKPDPVAEASMKPGLIEAIARAKGSVTLLGMLAPKYGVPYAVLNTLAQQGARK